MIHLVKWWELLLHPTSSSVSLEPLFLTMKERIPYRTACHPPWHVVSDWHSDWHSNRPSHYSLRPAVWGNGEVLTAVNPIGISPLTFFLIIKWILLLDIMPCEISQWWIRWSVSSQMAWLACKIGKQEKINIKNECLFSEGKSFPTSWWNESNVINLPLGQLADPLRLWQPCRV